MVHNRLLPAHREICDYIAGMTDGYFLRPYQPALKWSPGFIWACVVSRARLRCR